MRGLWFSCVEEQHAGQTVNFCLEKAHRVLARTLTRETARARFTEEELKVKVAEMGAAISAAYDGPSLPPPPTTLN